MSCPEHEYGEGGTERAKADDAPSRVQPQTWGQLIVYGH